jgi:hypothetical protein
MLLAVHGDARAQSCETMSGPARTDCFIARARILGQRSDIAAGTARKRSDEAFLRAATGTPPRAKPKHKTSAP